MIRGLSQRVEKFGRSVGGKMECRPMRLWAPRVFLSRDCSLFVDTARLIDAIHFREFPVHDQSDALRQGFGESQFQSTMSSSLGVEIHVRVNIQDVQSVSLGILVSRDPQRRCRCSAGSDTRSDNFYPRTGAAKVWWAETGRPRRGPQSCNRNVGN